MATLSLCLPGWQREHFDAFLFSFLSFVVLGIDFSQLISDRKPRVTVTKDMDFGETLGLRGKFEAV